MSAEYLSLFEQLDAPFRQFDHPMLGEAFGEELQVVSDLWVRTGYVQGIAAYLNFFLLKEFITTHDEAFPPRFATFKSMADSFYRTDLFVRDVTDSAKAPTGGISNPKVRQLMKGIMARHARLSIPLWMMTYFGFQLAEAVELQCEATDDEKSRHLAYMATAYRIMGVPFSSDRPLMERYARSIEAQHAGQSPNLEKHARNILRLGEMIGVSSGFANISRVLPERSREVYSSIHHRVRPNAAIRVACRLAGRLLVGRAVGKPRKAVPMPPP